MGLFSVVPLAANSAPGCTGAGRWVMVVSASCALFFSGAEGIQLDLHVLTKEVDSFRNCSYLVLGIAMMRVLESGFFVER